MNEYEKEFIKRVRKEIATMNLSQDAIAKSIGMTRATLSRVLNFKVDSIKAGHMLKLARLLDISLDEIIGIAVPVEVTFCSDCDNADRTNLEPGICLCMEHGVFMSDDDYCSRGWPVGKENEL